MNTDLNSLARTLAERLIRKVALATLTLAELRGSIVLDDNEGDSIEEAADDAIEVMLGEDWGCLDPEDPEDAAKILKFVNECEAVIREAIEKTIESQWIPVDSKNLPRSWQGCLLAGIEYWKSEKNRRPFVQYGYRVGDGWRSGGGGTIDPEREQVTHWMDFPNPPAIRSLKQSNSGTTQPAHERG